MFKFILKTIIYATYSVFLVVLIWIVIASSRSKALRTDANVIIMGNSTIEYGIDDRVRPKMLNLGLNADHLEYIYAKLKLMKEYNPHIDTLILGIDNAILFKDPTLGHSSDIHHPFYYDQYNFADIYYCLKNADINWNETYISRPFAPTKILAPLSIITGRAHKIQDLGIGMAAQIDDIATSQILYDNTTFHDGHLSQQEERELSISLYFLQKIYSYCNENGITLIFITPPSHKSIKDLRYITVLKKHFNNTRHLDYSELPLPDSCFADQIHINRNGVKILTKIFVENLMSQD